MEFSYELTPDEWRRTSVATLHLGPSWPAFRWGRAFTATIAIAAVLATVFVVAVWGSWAAAACGATVALGATIARVALADRFRSTGEAPPDAIAQGLMLSEDGLVDLVRASGEPELFPWDRVTHLVDARWAWLIGVGNDEWLVLPLRVLSAEMRAAVATELTSRTGRSFQPLP